MTAFGWLAACILFHAWAWPESFGKNIAQIRKGYDEEMRK